MITTAGGFAGTMHGQVLRRTERREVAIFLRDGALWVADFVDGHGHLFDAVTWFRFNCAAVSLTEGERRMLLESAAPISPELTARIEQLLHCEEVPRGEASI